MKYLMWGQVEYFVHSGMKLKFLIIFVLNKVYGVFSFPPGNL